MRPGKPGDQLILEFRGGKAVFGLDRIKKTLSDI
jgi:hypothetical protein